MCTWTTLGTVVTRPLLFNTYYVTLDHTWGCSYDTTPYMHYLHVYLEYTWDCGNDTTPYSTYLYIYVYLEYT